MKNLILLIALSILVSCKLQTDRRDSKDMSVFNSENYRKALVFYENNQYDKALELYKEIEKEMKGKYILDTLYFNKGYCELQLKMNEESISDFLQAVKLNYRTADAYHNIAVNYYMMLDDSLAIIYFQKSLSIDSNNSIAKTKIIELKRELVKNAQSI